MLKLNNYTKNVAVGTFIGLASWGATKLIITATTGAISAAYIKYKMKKALQKTDDNQ